MRIAKWIILIVVLLIVIAGVVVYFSLNGIVERTVETQATASLNLQTTLAGANLSLFGGRLGLNDLEIASPQGFTAPHMLTLDDAAVQVNYGELGDDPVRIQSVNLKGPKLVIEQSGGKFNIQALMQQESKAPPPEEGEPMKLIIDRLQVSDAQVVFHPGLPGLAESITVPVPDIDLKNVGTGDGNQNGAAIKQVVMEVVTAMADKAAESDKIPEELRTLLKLDVNQIAQQIGGEFNKQIGKISEQVSEKVNEQVENVQKEAGKAIEKGLGDLLKKTDGKKSDENGSAP